MTVDDQPENIHVNLLLTLIIDKANDIPYL